MIVQGAIYFEDGKQLLIDNGVSTELTAYSSGIDTGSLPGYLLNVARSYADGHGRLNPCVLDHAASHGWAQSTS